MIFGECPYCDGHVIHHMPEHTPAYSRIKCNTCHNFYWMEFSRVDPKAYREEIFLTLYKVDEADKSLTKINAE